jgi:soluble lytic murein transglycosylase
MALCMQSTYRSSFRSIFSRSKSLFLIKVVVWSALLPLLGQAAPGVSLSKNDSAVRELIARKQYVAAARMISRTTDSARIVQGHLFLRANRVREALDAFSKVIQAPPGLHDFFSLRKTQALLMNEQPTEALKELKKLRRPDLAASMATRLRARALRESGQFETARQAYQGLFENGHKADLPIALLGLARLEAETNNPAKALELLRRLDIEYPIHWTTNRASRLVETLKKGSSKARKRWAERTIKERVEQAERLLKAHRNQAVIKLLTPLTDIIDDVDLSCRQLFALGKALRKVRKWVVGRPLLNRAIKQCAKAKNELEPWARHIAGQAAERLSDETGAADHYREQMARHPEHRLADDGGYYVIRHLIDDQKSLKLAEKELGKLVVQFPKGDMMTHAVFFVAINAFKAGKYRQALRVLRLEDKLVLGVANYRRMGRTAYWRGRAQWKLGRRRAAGESYEAAFKAYPLSWYSILAYSRLREIDRRKADRLARQVLKKPATVSFLKGELPGGTRWSQARALAKHGLPTAAWAKLKSIKLENPQHLWHAAKLLDQAGAVHLSHNILRRKLSSFHKVPPAGSARQAWLTAYPRPLKHLIDRSAKLTGIPANLARAITREESGFNAVIESGANAVGLMQLLVPTAKGVGRPSDGQINRHTLKKPELNVRLGTRYLARVLKGSRATPHLIPAGYNAGTGALKRWLRARKQLPLDLFVELIPYEEARGYTKRVNQSWAIYQYLYANRSLPMYIGQSTMSPKKRIKRRKSRKKRKRRR